MVNPPLYPHLRLNEWPFSLLPDSYSETFLADRKQVKERINRIFNDMSKKPSSIYLVWGWFGAGKSHMLKYLRYLCLHRRGFLFSYTEFPKETRRTTFLHLYREFAKNLNWENLCETVKELNQVLGDEYLFERTICPAMPVFRKACVNFCYRPSQESSELAFQWLCAERVNLNLVRKIGITNRIETVEEAIEVLSSIVKLVSLSKINQRVVWVIDEFNNIEDINDSVVQKQILTTLNSILNRSSTNLTIILSFGTAIKENVRKILSLEPTLLTKTRDNPAIEIPEWDNDDEILEFVRERLSKYRPEPENTEDYFPFEEDSMREIIKSLRAEKSEDPSLMLVPRTILDRLDKVTKESEDLLKDGKIHVITKEIARRAIENLTKSRL